MRQPDANPLATRADLQQAFLSLEAPLLKAWDVNDVGPDLGAYRARYSVNTTRLEGVSRYLWGLAPFAAGGGVSKGWPLVLDAIVHGTDPQHPAYWGPAGDTDQRCVEMAALGVSLRIASSRIWDPLTSAQKDNLAAWLIGMLDKRLVRSNWQFFRLMVTLGLRHVGRAPKNVDDIEQSAIDVIDSLYLDGGWYVDGGPDQRDYYIPWAFHFYSLASAAFTESGAVSKRIEDWKTRAREFAGGFVDWFAGDGAALPFGRSLAYRFAQSAFFAGCAVAELPGLSAGQQKGMLLRNLRWWWKQPFLNDDGTLSLGYAYPNLNMLEPYNSSASPYWAFKAFAVLQLPETHPFWTAKEEPLPPSPSRRVQPQTRMVLDRDGDTGHVICTSAGQWHTWPLRHRDAKYAKFAYSTFFGPCVGPNHEWLEGVGIDNTLSILASSTMSEEGLLWQNHGRSSGHLLTGDGVMSSAWSTCPGVTVRSWIVPATAWHVRIHRVTTDHVIQLAEGGFAAEDPTEYARTDHGLCLKGLNGGLSGVIDLAGNRRLLNSDTEPNSSLYFSRVRIPVLTGRFEPGTHWLAVAVLGAAPGSRARWEEPPTLEWVPGQSAVVSQSGKRSTLDLAESPTR